MSCSPAREALLLAQGWTRQFTAAEPRLGEAVATYLSLGFAVHLEAVDPMACAAGQCTACFQEPEAAARLKVIFIRPAPRTGP